MLTTNSKLKKKIAEKIYRKKRGAHMWSFYSAYFMIEVVTIKHWGVWPGGTYVGQLAHVVSFWMTVFWNGRHVTLCQIVVSYAENRVQCI